jgi:hypothetical protein
MEDWTPEKRRLSAKFIWQVVLILVIINILLFVGC